MDDLFNLAGYYLASLLHLDKLVLWTDLTVNGGYDVLGGEKK